MDVALTPLAVTAHRENAILFSFSHSRARRWKFLAKQKWKQGRHATARKNRGHRKKGGHPRRTRRKCTENQETQESLAGELLPMPPFKAVATALALVDGPTIHVLLSMRKTF